MPLRSGLQQAQLEQVRELEAKLEEERRHAQQLCITLEQERTGHARRARAAGRVAQERILADGGAEQTPPALNRASQKIAAAALLLRAMPEPSMPEGRHLRK